MIIAQLQQKLINAYSVENLNLLSTKIIDFNNKKQKHCLKRMWTLVCDYNKGAKVKGLKYFSKLIMLYHPDKIADYHRQIKDVKTEIELECFAHIIPMLHLVNNMEQNVNTSFKTPEEFEYEYGWNYANTADDYFVDKDNCNEEENIHLFDEENLDDSFIFGTEQMYAEGTFIEAVKRKVYGPAQINFPTHQLEDFEEIEMAEYDIERLDGVEFCTYVKILDLSYNQIYDLANIEYCNRIQELYLQNNQIECIDVLGYLTDLRVLDLANNNISDIKILFGLKSLEFVNLLGNPVSKKQSKHLKSLGVVVVE